MWTYSFHLQPIQAQVGAFLPQGCPYLVSGLQSSSNSLHTPTPSFLSHEAPLPTQSSQPLAKAQVGAFDPGFRARRQDSLPYLGRLLGTPRGLEPPVKLGPVPASLAAGGRRGSAATSPHEAQPMGESPSGQPDAATACFSQ